MQYRKNKISSFFTVTLIEGSFLTKTFEKAEKRYTADERQDRNGKPTEPPTAVRGLVMDSLGR